MFDDPRIRQTLLREVGRGEDFFRSAVIEALGDYKALYAYDALVGRREARRSAAGRCGAGAGQDRRQARARDARGAAANRAAADTADHRRGDLSARRQLRLARELSDRDAEVRQQQPEPRIPGAAPRRRGGPGRAGRCRRARRSGRRAVRDRHPVARSDPRARRPGARRDRLAQHAADAVGPRKHARARSGHRSRRGRLRHARGRPRQGTLLRRRAARLLGCARGIADAPVDADADREAGLLMDYRQSGVDIDAGNETVRRIKSLARATFTPGVLSDIGSFGGLFRLDRDRFRDPVLVSSADGVGTKLKVAFMTGRHDTVGADLVNHCVNDILVQGAEPLFFLDYLATGRLSPDVAEQVIGGIARACRENGCALIGGETAEMPGLLCRRRIRYRRLHRRRRRPDEDRRRPDDRAGRRPDRSAVGRPAHQRLFARPARVLRRRGLQPDTFVRSSARRRAPRCSRRTALTCRSSVRCSSASTSRAWRTSPAAASRRICRGCFRKVARRKSI